MPIMYEDAIKSLPKLKFRREVDAVPDQRIIDWIRDELQRARDDNDTVSVGDAYRIAFSACEKTLRAVGGL